MLATRMSRDRGKAHHGTIKSISSLAIGNMGRALLGAVGGVLVARFIGPEINGQFRLFTIPLMYLTFLHLGNFDGLNRQIPFYVGKERSDQVLRIASAAGAWNIYVAIVVGAGFLVCALWGLVHGDWIAAVGWLTQALSCIGLYYGGYLGATYRTADHFVSLVRIQMLQSLVAFCLIATVALWGFYGLCLRAAIPALLGVWLCHRARPLRMPLRFDRDALGEVVKIGLPLCFWGTLYTSLWLAAEYSFMLHFGGVKAVGLFSVALIIRESLSTLPQSVHQVFMPRAAEAFARDGMVGNSARGTFRLAILLSLFMIAVVLLTSFLLNYFVPFFIPKYADGLMLMKVCLGAAIIHAASIPLNGLVSTGRSWLYGKGILAGLVAFPLAVYLLEPLIGGILAVAAGSLIGRLVRTVLAYRDLFRLIKREAY